jgi:NAD-dependent dihydropyrimidine dehydrogenase PreA subunit
MRKVIHNEPDKCVGCNRCVRVCPIDEANIVCEVDGRIVAHIDNDKCIACGACQTACHHGSRYYEDDTERFFADLKRGVRISMFAAPAMKTNFDHWGRLLTWLRQCGVESIYDVSLGADICTWAHIRYVQKNGPSPIISQPCPAIVNYILMHKNELVKYLSPVHSPMLCTAVYMRKYEGVRAKIAALSPCLAKVHEFEATGLVEYNVTIKHLYEYMERNRVVLPPEEGGFDHYEAGLGSLYPMPGGLKECVEHYVGKSLRVDKSEGPGVVYKALDEYAHQPPGRLPVLFDVLNCAEGCNLGTGCRHEMDVFEINTMMDDARQAAIDGEEAKRYLDQLFETFDAELRIDDFIRTYKPAPVQKIGVTREKINAAFMTLGKVDEASRVYDCGACGSNSCQQMAEKIAKGINIPANCAEHANAEVKKEHEAAISFQKSNLSDFVTIMENTGRIKELTDGILDSIGAINKAIELNAHMVKDIEKIALQTRMISINAAIESARAGEHGKAFAMVAGEIQRLAQSSNDSAQMTKEASMQAGVAIVSVNDKIDKIGKNVNEFYKEVSTIAENTRKLLQESEKKREEKKEAPTGYDSAMRYVLRMEEKDRKQRELAEAGGTLRG